MYKFWIVLLITTNIFGMEEFEEKDKVTILCGGRVIKLHKVYEEMEVSPFITGQTVFPMGAPVLNHLCEHFKLGIPRTKPFKCPIDNCKVRRLTRLELIGHIMSMRHLNLHTLCPLTEEYVSYHAFRRHRPACSACKNPTENPTTYSFEPKKPSLKKTITKTITKTKKRHNC